MIFCLFHLSLVAVWRHLLLLPLRPVLQLVVQQLHGFPPDRRQLISHQPSHHRDEGIRGQQGVHLGNRRQRWERACCAAGSASPRAETDLVQNVVGFIQQDSPELGGGFVGVRLHAASHAVDVTQDLLQQPENTRHGHLPPHAKTHSHFFTRQNSRLLQPLERLVHAVSAVCNLRRRAAEVHSTHFKHRLLKQLLFVCLSQLASTYNNNNAKATNKLLNNSFHTLNKEINQLKLFVNKKLNFYKNKI